MWDTIQEWAGKPRSYPLATTQVAISIGSGDVDYRSNPLRGIYVGTAGVVYVRALEDTDYVAWTCENGTLIPVLVTGVRASGTTATNMVGLR